MATARRSIHLYPEAALAASLSAVRDGMSVREASRQYNVPRSTIQDRISGRIKDGPRKMGPPTVLSTHEELKLAKWLKELAKASFPQKKTDLINTVQRIVQEEKRSTPFTKDGRPGEKWYAGFVRRPTKKNKNEAKENEDATKDIGNETGEKDEIKKNGNKVKGIASTKNNKNETGERDKTKENRNEAKAMKDSTKDNKNEPEKKDETKKNKNEANATKYNEHGTLKKDEYKENRNEAKRIIKDETNATKIKKDTDNLADLTSKSFEDHLFWPGPLESQKRNKREKLPSAVSSLAYRKYLEEKELQKKNEQENRERRKQERKQKANERKTALQEKTRTKKSKKDDIGKQENKKTKPKHVDDEEVTKQIKCSACDDELVSDVEEDDLKNLGCDNCERWFHLMCTEFVGLPYLEVQNRDFVCFYCS